MFQGNFDALRRQAEEEEKYCLVNIQKRQEFADYWSFSYCEIRI
jgi:hypothetical protein